jgi:hypothetical protein
MKRNLVIHFTIFDKIGVAISIIMIVMLFAMSLKVSGFILEDFEFMGFFQIWLLFGFYYLVNMFIRLAYLSYKKDKKETEELDA